MENELEHTEYQPCFLPCWSFVQQRCVWCKKIALSWRECFRESTSLLRQRERCLVYCLRRGLWETSFFFFSLSDGISSPGIGWCPWAEPLQTWWGSWCLTGLCPVVMTWSKTAARKRASLWLMLSACLLTKAARGFVMPKLIIITLWENPSPRDSVNK